MRVNLFAARNRLIERDQLGYNSDDVPSIDVSTPNDACNECRYFQRKSPPSSSMH